MIHFPDSYFQKIEGEQSSAEVFNKGARRDLKIAVDSNVPEVKFKFAYDTMIKMGLALIASEGYRVRSSSGHHIKIIEKISQLLGDPSANYLGNRMRQIRNDDLYHGGVMISEKDSEAYLRFVKNICSRGSKIIKDKNAT